MIKRRSTQENNDVSPICSLHYTFLIIGATIGATIGSTLGATIGATIGTTIGATIGATTGWHDL